MQCARAKDQLSEYIEGSLSPAMLQVFEQHLSICAACRADVEQIRALYGLFDEGLPILDPPPGFRAGILNAIREQPAPDTFLSRLRSRLAPVRVGQTKLVPVSAAIVFAIVAIGGGSVLSSRFNHSPGQVSSMEASLSPWQAIRVGVQNDNGILQGVRTYNSGGDTYHVFGLHLPSGMAATSVSTYVVQNPAALTTDADLQDQTDATPTWSGAIEPGVSVQVPVAVVSNVPSGTSMTVLAKWADSTGERKEVCILPISAPAEQSMVVSSGEPLLQALESVAVAYKTPIMLNAAAVSQLSQPISQGLDSSDTTMDDCLAALVLPDSLTFKQQSDGSYLIDGQ